MPPIETSSCGCELWQKTTFGMQWYTRLQRTLFSEDLDLLKLVWKKTHHPNGGLIMVIYHGRIQKITLPGKPVAVNFHQLYP